MNYTGNISTNSSLLGLEQISCQLSRQFTYISRTMITQAYVCDQFTYNYEDYSDIFGVSSRFNCDLIVTRRIVSCCCLCFLLFLTEHETNAASKEVDE